MLVRFQNQSNRVKGIAFHPQRPWVLTSLHNGVIQLWDYRMETLIDKFEEHDGPVRGVHFHRSQPLFVSGGDDYKIKVWNYQQKRCLFNLTGHLDYIRTVQFHHEYPWILSASDDQTLRIWNWQSRQCLTVLTGHNHYVMCAQFHPKDDLILSASLDQTIRVWDMSGFRKKAVSIQNDFSAAPSSAAAELFGTSDITVKHLLEGHTRGVNWASFHRTQPLIVSGADDREVKLWRMNEVKAWEVDTLRGHINNVSSVIFHPKRELIISNSEDKSIRVWDMTKANSPLVFRRDNDRYWILDAHPTLNLIAAGHDSGMLVFKLERERPAYDVLRKEFYYYRDQYLRSYDVKTGKDSPVLSFANSKRTTVYRSLQYNAANKSQHCFLALAESNDALNYELHIFGKASSQTAPVALSGPAKAAVWVSKNRFVVLDRQRQLTIRDLKNDAKKKLALPGVTVLQMFSAGVGRLLLRVADGVIMYDIQVMKPQGKLNITSRHPVKYVVWSAGHRYCALFSKANIYIVDAEMRELCQISETSRIKSGVWDPSGVFVYTTTTHIKYLLRNGDSGILRTMDQVIYLTSATSTTLHYLDREAKVGTLAIDATEYLFKLALVKRRYKDVHRIMKANKLVGHSIISYLQRKGFPEVALFFVQDPKTRFSLALECGNIGVALECAKELDEKECWHRLGVEALRHGNHQVVEAAYQKTLNFERLSFLYLITGNVDKLNKMLQISTIRRDVLARFHNALYLGNIEERIKVLREAGQLQLAYVAARAHGLDDEMKQLEQELGDNCPQDLPASIDQATLVFPPSPILKESNWPLLDVRKGYFDGPAGDEGPEEEIVSDYEEDEKRLQGGLAGEKAAGPDVWGDEEETKRDESKVTADSSAGGWGGDLLADIGLDMSSSAGPSKSEEAPTADLDGFVMPLPGRSAFTTWSDDAVLTTDHIVVGAFEQAVQSLQRQIGAVNFAPFQETFLTIYAAARAAMPQLVGSSVHLTMPLKSSHTGGPLVPYSHEDCLNSLRSGARAVTEEKLEEALAAFRQVLFTIPFVNTISAAQEGELKEMVLVCREYIGAVRLELARRAAADPVRQCALAAYFTKCKLQPVHTALGLKVAIKSALAVKNFKMASGFCRRILDMFASPAKDKIAKVVDVNQIKGVLKHCERPESNTDAVDVDYKEGVMLELDFDSFTPIPKNKKAVHCPYCHSSYRDQFEEQTCVNCTISKVGMEASGLVLFHARAAPEARNDQADADMGADF